MMFKKKWAVLLIAVLAVLWFAPMAPAANPAGFDDNEIRIGQWGPQTGPAAPWGSVARGSKLLFDVVNEEGGINGRKIKYFIRDDMYNPAQTVAVVKELVERQGVFAFVGGVGSACGMAVKDYLAANKILWVGPSAADQDFVHTDQSLSLCGLSALQGRGECSGQIHRGKAQDEERSECSTRTTPTARTVWRGPRSGWPRTK